MLDPTTEDIANLLYKYSNETGSYLGITGPLVIAERIQKAIKAGTVRGVAYAASIKEEKPSIVIDPAEIDANAEDRRTDHHA